jgi:hypothetical protein
MDVNLIDQETEKFQRGERKLEYQLILRISIPH